MKSKNKKKKKKEKKEKKQNTFYLVVVINKNLYNLLGVREYALAFFYCPLFMRSRCNYLFELLLTYARWYIADSEHSTWIQAATLNACFFLMFHSVGKCMFDTFVWILRFVCVDLPWSKVQITRAHTCRIENLIYLSIKLWICNQCLIMNFNVYIFFFFFLLVHLIRVFVCLLLCLCTNTSNIWNRKTKL